MPLTCEITEGGEDLEVVVEITEDKDAKFRTNECSDGNKWFHVYNYRLT